MDGKFKYGGMETVLQGNEHAVQEANKIVNTITQQENYQTSIFARDMIYATFGAEKTNNIDPSKKTKRTSKNKLIQNR